MVIGLPTWWWFTSKVTQPIVYYETEVYKPSNYACMYKVNYVLLVLLLLSRDLIKTWKMLVKKETLCRGIYLPNYVITMYKAHHMMGVNTSHHGYQKNSMYKTQSEHTMQTWVIVIALQSYCFLIKAVLKLKDKCGTMNLMVWFNTTIDITSANS